MSLSKPQNIFLFFSLLVGFVLVFLTPPIAIIDENQHIRRTSEISQLVMFNPQSETTDKLSLWAENAWAIRKGYANSNQAWKFYGVKNISAETPKERAVDAEKNIFSLNSPVAYIPLAVGLRLVNEVSSPDYYIQFYILRLTALISSIALLYLAIARMPEHKTLLAAAFLLPVIFFNRSGVNVDGITIGIISLFLVQIFRLCREEGFITAGEKFLLFFLALLTAQCKGAYIPLLFLVFLIPAGNYRSRFEFWLVSLLVIIVSMVAGLAWSGFAGKEVLAGIKYVTEGNQEVWPDGQLAWIFANPLSFIAVLFKTVFSAEFMYSGIIGMIGFVQWNNFNIPMVSLVLLILLLMAIAALEPVGKRQYKPAQKLAVLAACAAVTAMMLTLLYIQWTGYKAPVVAGFQGRYFLPLLPLLVAFAKPIETANNKYATALLWLFGLVSSVSILWAVLGIKG